MAKKIIIDKRYKITLKKAVKAGRTWLRPGTTPIVLGAVLETIKDSVADYNEV